MSLGVGERRTTATTTMRRKKVKSMMKTEQQEPANNNNGSANIYVERNPKSTKHMLKEMNISMLKTIKY